MNIDMLVLARVVHVLGVVIWIGGVDFVTAVLLPALRAAERSGTSAEMFERLEGRFAWIARGATLLVGASGFYMVVAFHIWDRFASLSFWWMHAMVLVWTIFVVMLFVAEPLRLHRWLGRGLKERPGATLALMARLHWVLFLAAIVTVAGAVAGSHGGL
jgi:uncharacterized membrane protein